MTKDERQAIKAHFPTDKRGQGLGYRLEEEARRRNRNNGQGTKALRGVGKDYVERERGESETSATTESEMVEVDAMTKV